MSAIPVRHGRGILLAAAACLTLAACGSGKTDLGEWMEQQRREVKPNVTPLPAPTKFEPRAYVGATDIDPFSSQKMAVAVTQEMRQPNSVLAAEMNRRREPLEAYPLDSVAMVGSVLKEGRQMAILKVDNLLYQVKVGDYLGQNYGRITKVSETEIDLREIVQDAAGEWVERPGSLQLQEQAK